MSYTSAAAGVLGFLAFPVWQLLERRSCQWLPNRGPDVLYCMPNRTKYTLLVSMVADRSATALLYLASPSFPAACLFSTPSCVDAHFWPSWCKSGQSPTSLCVLGPFCNASSWISDGVLGARLPPCSASAPTRVGLSCCARSWRWCRTG
jgi:hypothetical protein